MKRILMTITSLLLTLAVVAVGAVMPSLLSRVLDERLEYDVMLQSSEAVKLTFAKKTPPTGLDSVAYFSCLDVDSGQYTSEDHTLTESRVRESVYEFFTRAWCADIFDKPITTETYENWHPVILSIHYDIDSNKSENVNPDDDRVFWTCSWEGVMNKKYTVWVDDASARIVAFHLDLGDSLGSEYTDGKPMYNYVIEHRIVNAFTGNFLKYFEADSANVSYMFFGLPLRGEFVDAWIVNFILSEQHYGVSSSSIVNTALYFTKHTVYFNLIDPGEFFEQ